MGAAAAEAVADRLVREFRLPPGIVSGYWPLADEFDPRPAMVRLAGLGHPLALPRVQGGAGRWPSTPGEPGDPLLAGPFQVMEPSPERRWSTPHPARPAARVRPGGRRLGYGAGYYDMVLRDLCARGPRRSRSASAFAVQEVAEVPTGPRDQMLDAVVTEQACIVAPRTRALDGSAMRLLFCGDVVGRAGRKVLLERLPKLRAELALDAVIVNGENAAGGFGLTPAICQDLFAAGADLITTGNHVFDQREILPAYGP